MTQRVISCDVECPWCGAQPGQDCTEASNYPPYVRPLPTGHGHLARVTPDDVIPDYTQTVA